MTFSDFHTWARLGFLGDDGKEICNYMGQHEAGCSCEQSTSNWGSYHSPRWDDGATLRPACASRCTCSSPISLAHTQGTVLTET